MHGAAEAVAWGRTLASDLQAYKAGKLAWSEVDRGAVVAGPPGCGKTSFAKSLALQCGVPLVATSYGDWQSAGTGHLGDVTRKLRNRFEEARFSTPCIMFIDELDSVGTRGKSDQHDDWWRAIINILLAELDGIHGREGVVVVGATNDIGHIDPAIVRSGRMDRVIRMGLPNDEALEAILRDHLGDAADADLDLTLVARRSFGSTGADCERWARGARRRARKEGGKVTTADLLAEVAAADNRTEENRYRAAIHEAGHAVVIESLRPGIVRVVSIKLMGPHAGFVSVPDTLNYLPSEVELLLAEFMAGRAAEEVIFGEADCGGGGETGSDLALATRTILRAAMSLGLGGSLVWHGKIEMDDIGPIFRARPDLIPVVETRLNQAHARAVEIIRERRAAVMALARVLMEVLVLSGDEVREIAARNMISDGPNAL